MKPCGGSAGLNARHCQCSRAAPRCASSQRGWPIGARRPLAQCHRARCHRARGPSGLAERGRRRRRAHQHVHLLPARPVLLLHRGERGSQSLGAAPRRARVHRRREHGGGDAGGDASGGGGYPASKRPRRALYHCAQRRGDRQRRPRGAHRHVADHRPEHAAPSEPMAGRRATCGIPEETAPAWTARSCPSSGPRAPALVVAGARGRFSAWVPGWPFGLALAPVPADRGPEVSAAG